MKHKLVAWSIGVSIAIFVGLARPNEALAAKLLLVYSDFDSNATFVKSNLVATGKFTNSEIDILNMIASGVPPLSLLLNYDCVYVWTLFPPPKPVAQGDRLKEYVEAGGGVVLYTYALSRPFTPWKIQGGIMEDGFNPLDLLNTSLSAFPRSLDFATALTSHSILAGVADFTYDGNPNYAELTLDPGAVLIANDNLGKPLIAISASGQVASINVYPGSFFSKSPGVWRAFANACEDMAGPLTVDIDIKPGSDPNAINPRNRGLIPVGILTSDSFDARTISPVTVQFGPGAPSMVHRSGHLEDVDADGDLDLVLHFRTQETGIQCGDTEASVTGETFAGQPIQGSDSIRTIGCYQGSEGLRGAARATQKQNRTKYGRRRPYD